MSKDTCKIGGKDFTGSKIACKQEGRTILHHPVSKGGKSLGHVDAILFDNIDSFRKVIVDNDAKALHAMYLYNRMAVFDAANQFRASIGRPVTAGTAINRAIKGGNKALETELAALLKKHGMVQS